MGEKTEQATSKKLRDARKKGQVAKAQDLPSAFTFIASVATVLAMSSFLYQKLTATILLCFAQIGNSDVGRIIPSLYMEGFITIFLASMPVLMVVSFIGVLINFLTIGPVFSTEVFKPDIKKFDIIQNLKQKFKLKTLIELLKSIFKISIASYLIYEVMYNSIPELIRIVSLPTASAMLVFYSFLYDVLIRVGLLFFVIAIADFIYQRKAFAKEMMMEKFEVKQEYKNSEGDPHIKGRRRQIAQEIAYQEGPAQQVQGAKAVVTNPTHLAIAIGYNKALDSAPYIRIMGDGDMAQLIIRLAEKFNVPVIRNIELARELWENGEINQYVPEETFDPLAKILLYIASLQGEQEVYAGEDLDK